MMTSPSNADLPPDVLPPALPESHLAAVRRVVGYDHHLTGSEVDRLWQGVAQRIHTHPPRRASATWGHFAIPARSVSRLRIGIAMAAACGIAAWGLFATLGRMPERRVYATGAGEQKTVQFADGSRVTLGPQTTITVSRGTDGTTADLRGEALFDVASHAHQAFRVRANQAVVQVLGTRFLVRQYPREKKMTVAVLHGRVSLRALRETTRTTNDSTLDSTTHAPAHTVLGANMVAVVNDSGRIDAAADAHIEDYVGWISGRLVFRGTQAAQIADELSRVYGLDIQIHDSTLRKQRLTLEVSVAEKPFAAVLDAVAYTLRAHVVRKNDTITFVPGPAAPSNSSSPPRQSHQETQYGR